MISLLVEGLESALLPCSFVLLVPGAAAVLASRQESTSAFVGFSIGVSTVAFWRFSGRLGDISNLTIALALGVAVVLLAIPIVRRLNIVTGAGGLFVGAAAGALWEPCVSVHFGDLLNELPARTPMIGVVLLVVYMTGVIAPLIVLAAVLHLVPDPALILARPVMLVVGCGTLALIALGTAAGFSDEIIGRLVEMSVA